MPRLPLLRRILAAIGSAVKKIRPRHKTEKMRLGAAGEDIAEKHLRKIGYAIVARNIRVGRDEIDIIARDKEELVFVEVKTRTIRDEAQRGSGYEAVDRRKRTALARAVRAYLYALRPATPPHRFDIIEVEFSATGTTGGIGTAGETAGTGTAGDIRIAHQRRVPLFSYGRRQHSYSYAINR